MNLAMFKIKTMCGQEYPIEAFTESQAITIWKSSKPTELFRSCQKIKSSKEIDRYWELKDLPERSKNDLAELELIVDNFHETAIFKTFKKFNSFKLIPKEE